MTLQDRLDLFKNIPDEKAGNHTLEFSLKELREISKAKLKYYNTGEDEFKLITQEIIDQMQSEIMFRSRLNRAVKKLTEIGMLSGLKKLEQIEEILNG